MSRGGSGGSGDFMGDVLEGLGKVLDFLGAGVGGDLVDAASNAYDKNQAYAEAEAVFYDSLAACGNEGQMVIINELGPDAYKAAVDYGFENEGDVSGTLTGEASHPEAVEEILGEAEEAIGDIVENAMSD